MQQELPNGDIFKYSYKLKKDCFVNTVLLEISQEKTFYPVDVKYENVDRLFKIEKSVIKFNLKERNIKNFSFF